MPVSVMMSDMASPKVDGGNGIRDATRAGKGAADPLHRVSSGSRTRKRPPPPTVESAGV